ncbi:hypothetical protein SCYAM73S_04906 [Streptomyces cyaneofuscatus]
MHSPLRLYGRSGELAILEGLLARLWQGDGGALVVTAPPGLGRSALLREAAAAHRPRGPVLYATASPDERGPHALPRTPEALLARLRDAPPARCWSAPTTPTPGTRPPAPPSPSRPAGWAPAAGSPS